jgi:methyl-accepting chemotaxis protein
MFGTWTFGRKLGAGFAIVVALTVVMAAVATYALRTVVASKDQVIAVHARNLVDGAQFGSMTARKNVIARGFIVDKDDKYFEEFRNLRSKALFLLARVRERTSDPEGHRLVEELTQREADHHAAIERVMALRRTDAPTEAVARVFDEEDQPRRVALAQAIDALSAYNESLLEKEKEAATRAAGSAESLLLTMVVLVIVVATGIAVLLTRALSRQIGAGVGQVQSSSAELQAAATQQATSSREQATAMNEITTTITELLAASRQIAESAQRVAQIAEQTAGGARAGQGAVDLAQDAIGGIRRQVDQIVAYMLELGKKSQQIGAVLDIVSELAEQTNILAINATIEAAGAGDGGRRFAVVADEIRKLADRVGGSTKEIRTLIDDVRSAVNTTVMATETGSKSVDAGSEQFGQVASGFRHISDLVTTTSDAAREIELTTKQQTTAVEQVNIAIANVAQASRETEASAGQTLQTASELAHLSTDLARIIRPQRAAA